MAIKPLKSAVVDLDYLHVEVQPEFSLITLFWKRQVNISELRTGFYTAIEIARSYKCRNWLGDTRQTTLLGIANNEYLIRDLVNLISETPIEKIARVIRGTDPDETDFFSMRFKEGPGQRTKIHFITEIFTSKAEAKKWLLG